MYNAITEILAAAENVVFFTGAGMSTESGIPDFRSASGLYSQDEFEGYAPEFILSRSFFLEYPQTFYEYYFTNIVHADARPNEGHMAIAEMEKYIPGISVITQNIDGLHSEAGSTHVIELHGSVYKNHCTVCKEKYNLEYMVGYEMKTPVCRKCGEIVRPDVTLYEEPLETKVFSDAIGRIASADVLFAIGSSLTVFPAAGMLDYFKGKLFVIINRDETDRDNEADFIIRDSCGKVLRILADELNERNFQQGNTVS